MDTISRGPRRDVDRVARIDAVKTAAQAKLVSQMDLFAPSTSGARMSLIGSNSSGRLNERAAMAFSRVPYFEQPMACNPEINRPITVFDAAKRKSVVIEGEAPQIVQRAVGRFR